MKNQVGSTFVTVLGENICLKKNVLLIILEIILAIQRHKMLFACVVANGIKNRLIKQKQVIQTFVAKRIAFFSPCLDGKYDFVYDLIFEATLLNNIYCCY